MTAPSFPHTWLGGHCVALLHDLPVGATWQRGPDGFPLTIIDDFSPRRTYPVVVLNLPDGSVPSAGVSGGGGPCGDHDELRAKAEAATAGPWHEGYRWVFVLPADRRSALVDVMTKHDADLPSGDAQANAVYIAAANPTVVLGLLDEIDRLRALAGCGGHGPQPEGEVIEDELSVVVRSDVRSDDRYVWGGVFCGDDAMKNAAACAERENEDWPTFAPFRLYLRHRVVTEQLIGTDADPSGGA